MNFIFALLCIHNCAQIVFNRMEWNCVNADNKMFGTYKYHMVETAIKWLLLIRLTAVLSSLILAYFENNVVQSQGETFT
jgi:hypothetical protein